MNKFIFFKVFLAIMLFAISGCGDENQPTSITIENREALNQTVYADETPATVSFATKGAWTSTISEGATKSTVSWLSISPDRGDEAGSYTITISMAPNATGSDRSATITIKCEGTTITVTVTQKATKRDGTNYDSDITVINASALAQIVYNDETPEALSIVTKGAWTSTKTETWISISPDHGKEAGSYTITFNRAPNFTGNDRSATITITCGETSIPVNITQKATYTDEFPDLQVSNSTALTQTLYADDTRGEKLSIFTKGAWTSTNTATWVQITPYRGSNSGSYGIGIGYLEKNLTGSDRTAEITITCGETSITMNITQKGTFRDGTDPSVDVYVAGYRGNENSLYYFELWKNSVAQNLYERPNTRAYSVFVSGSDVYVAGVEGTSIRLWKNGIAQNFSDNYGSSARSVFVSGSDVYVAGGASGSAALWKNGELQWRKNDSGINISAWATSVFVSGIDVYVTGIQTFNISSANNKAKLWKNGVEQNLDGGDRAEAYSVYVSGDDVYVAGYILPGDTYYATLWKNGVAQNLGSGFANSVFVSGNDVYVAGCLGYDAVLWINGVAQKLIRTTGSYKAEARSVYVSGNNNVYVAGTEYYYDTANVAILWINGVVHNLDRTAGDAAAESVFVVKK